MGTGLLVYRGHLIMPHVVCLSFGNNLSQNLMDQVRGSGNMVVPRKLRQEDNEFEAKFCLQKQKAVVNQQTKDPGQQKFLVP